MSSERHGPRSTARLAEPSAHRRTPAPHAPEAPTKPPQRAKIYALTAGAACGAAEVCPRPYAVKQRETSGLVRQMRRQEIGCALVSCTSLPGSRSQEKVVRPTFINIKADRLSEPLRRPLQLLADRQGKSLIGAAPDQKQGRQ